MKISKITKLKKRKRKRKEVDILPTIKEVDEPVTLVGMRRKSSEMAVADGLGVRVSLQCYWSESE